MWLRLAGVAVVALALYGLYWAIDDRGYQRGKNDERAAQLEAAKKLIERFNQAEVQHDQDQATIARLAADAQRVRVHIPTCPASSADTDGSARVLSNGVDEEFGRLQTRVGELVERCDQLNIDAIRANGVSRQ